MIQTETTNRENGTTALLVAASLVLLMGMAAIAVDVGSAFNERRQNQTVADVAVMAGVVEYAQSGEQGVAFEQAITTAALNLAASNLTTSYTQAEWEAMWEACSDPDKNTTGGTFNFAALTSPWDNNTELDCVSLDNAGFLRVRVPDQIKDTTFARVIGFDETTTHAWAIGTLDPSPQGGVLPFAVLGGAGAGHYCLRTDTGNNNNNNNNNSSAPNPCSGPQTGNFGTIDSPLFGNVRLDTDRVCSQTAQFDVLATNIALGLDHPVFQQLRPPDADPAHPRVEDQCSSSPIKPNALNVDEGMGQGTEQGLVNGSSGDYRSGLAIPRLQQVPDGYSHVSNTNGDESLSGPEWEVRTIKNEILDDMPLWRFLLPHGYEFVDEDGNPTGLSLFYGTNAPSECNPSTFATPGTSDWDGDGSVDPTDASFWHMQACIVAYVDPNEDGDTSDSFDIQIFSDTRDDNYDNTSYAIRPLSDSPRFAYVPQFWDETFPNSNTFMDIKRYRAIYLQGLWFGSGNNQEDFHPGEGAGENYSGNLRQVSAFIIPDKALPSQLRSDPPPDSLLESFFTTTLYR